MGHWDLFVDQSKLDHPMLLNTAADSIFAIEVRLAAKSAFSACSSRPLKESILIARSIDVLMNPMRNVL